jgi:hypothetical protein
MRVKEETKAAQDPEVGTDRHPAYPSRRRRRSNPRLRLNSRCLRTLYESDVWIEGKGSGGDKLWSSKRLLITCAKIVM